jgi:hypothetical protein
MLILKINKKNNKNYFNVFLKNISKNNINYILESYLIV